MPAFKAILWDNDGVLVDTEHLYLQATREVLATAGVALSDAQYCDLFLNQNNGAWHLASALGHSEPAIARMREARDARYSALLRARDHTIAGVERRIQRYGFAEDTDARCGQINVAVAFHQPGLAYRLLSRGAHGYPQAQYRLHRR